MCDVTSIVLLAAGAGMQYQGQRKAAKKVKNTMNEALAKQEALRKEALRNSEEVVNGQGGEAITAESQKPQQIVNQESVQGDAIAKAFAESSGTKASDQGRIITASSGAKRTAKNEATRQGFTRALQANLARLGNLQTNNTLLGADSTRINADLPWYLDQAGRTGANERLLGSLALTGAQAGLSNQAWQPRNQTSTAGMTV